MVMHTEAIKRAQCMILIGFLALLALLKPTTAWACACGCGVFEVGTGSMMPTQEGGLAYIEYDMMDQNRNWSGSSSAPAANNSDKEISTNFYTAGLEYLFSREWGIHVQIPYWERTFKTTDDSGNALSANFSGLGDVRIDAIYTGFSPDLSSGLTIGLKLPTGSYKDHPDIVDRDTQIGSGSTDLLLGGYHVGAFSVSSNWNWFAQAKLDNPLTGQDGYFPGSEVDLATGAYYDLGSVSLISKLAPVLTLKASNRMPDSGPQAAVDENINPQSGYTRVLVAPGVEADFGSVRIFADVEMPVYQYVNGNQLVADTLYKLVVGYLF